MAAYVVPELGLKSETLETGLESEILEPDLEPEALDSDLVSDVLECGLAAEALESGQPKDLEIDSVNASLVSGCEFEESELVPGCQELVPVN